MDYAFNASAHPSVRIAPTAGIFGAVSLGAESSVWAGAQLRGDLARIEIGEGSNVQENAVIHVDVNYPVRVGKNVTIGHGAIVHGATIDDDCTIGMGAIVLNGAHIGAGSMVAAGALVSQGKEFPPKSLIMGIPGKVVRELSDEESQNMCAQGGHDYVEESARMVEAGAMAFAGADWHGQTGAEHAR